MQSLIIENKYGQQLQLVGNPNYDVLSIDGLTPSSATINRSIVATVDGSKVNSSYANERNIVMVIRPKCDIEANRINLYKFIKIKQQLKIYYKNESRDVYIEGYVESFDGDLFENGQSFQISIVCPQPYFKAIDNLVTSFSATKSMFEFPFSIEESGIELATIVVGEQTLIPNNGDEETGAIIQIYARDIVLEPTIYNYDTNEFFTIEIEMFAGDMVEINTNKGNKSIAFISNGVRTNILNKIVKGSTWFTLKSGDNVFLYDCVHGAVNADVKFIVDTLYEGV